MQEAFEQVHAHDDSKSDRPEDWEKNEGLSAEKKSMSNLNRKTVKLITYRQQCVPETVEAEDVEELRESEVEEHFGELSVRKGQSPETQVRGSVGHGT